MPVLLLLFLLLVTGAYTWSRPEGGPVPRPARAPLARYFVNSLIVAVR